MRKLAGIVEGVPQEDSFRGPLDKYRESRAYPAIVGILQSRILMRTLNYTDILVSVNIVDLLPCQKVRLTTTKDFLDEIEKLIQSIRKSS